MRALLSPVLVLLVAVPWLAAQQPVADTPPAAKDQPAGSDAAEADAKALLVELVINGSTVEEPRPPQPFGPQPRNFREKLRRIRALAADPAVHGVELEIKGTPDHARTLDLIEALGAFRAHGKPMVCYAESLSRAQLVFASMADLLVVPPSGMIVLDGYVAEAFYMKDLLAKLDARAEVLHVGEFKTAYENFAKDEMSAGQREVLGAVLEEFWDQTTRLVADERGMQPAALEELFARVIVQPAVAAEAGLIDAALYRDEYDARVEELLGRPFERDDSYGEQSLEELERMLENPFAAMGLMAKALNPPKPKIPDEPYVAVVYASGVIQTGKSQSDFAGNVSAMGSETIVGALRKVKEDEHCKAVVLRVNSPGGSALASDMIKRGITEVQAAGKPVVVSMGSVAASGGYWISMAADVIVAQPSTLTGSIGVVSLVPDVSGSLESLGINVQTVARGPAGDSLSVVKHGLTPLLRDVITRMMEDVYQDFLQGVSDGRDMPVERVRELAAGRVWTGRQAEANGLVDTLGGLRDALDLAAVMAGLDPEEAPLVELPEAPNFFDQLEEAMGDMVRARTPLDELAASLGFDALLAHLRAQLAEPRALTPDRVQALLPLHVVIR